jgi:NAD(P)-dependent dehydrogenase (short-subunit alcohol dehydrogenase family)
MAHGFDLSGTRMLVTGAASGIGAATARCAIACGARVHLADLSETVTACAERLGRAAAAHRCDVAEPTEVEALLRAVGPVDALVHAAGICPFDDWLDPGFAEALDRVLAVNLKSAVHLAQAVLPGMVERRRGRIVLVGSLAGKTGGLIAGPHYVAAKGGLHALVKWLAQQGGPHGVLANGVAPASIETPMMEGRPVDTGRIPLRRRGLPDEVAWPIVFLCSPAASYVTGAILDVNGGVSMG